MCFETLYHITDCNDQLGRYHFIDRVSTHIEDVDIVKCEKLVFRFVPLLIKMFTVWSVPYCMTYYNGHLGHFQLNFICHVDCGN